MVKRKQPSTHPESVQAAVKASKAEAGASKQSVAKHQSKTNQQNTNSNKRKPASDEHDAKESESEEEKDALLRPKQPNSQPSAAQHSDSAAVDGSSDDDDDSTDDLIVNIIERPASSLPPTPSRSSRPAASDSDSDDDEEDESEAEAGLTINAEYAAQYEADKRQQELSKKAQRGKKKSDMIALVHQEMGAMDEDDNEGDGDDDGEGEEDEDEDEDDEGALLTEELDVRIHETLNAIKRKDPRVYDKSTVFFADDEEAEGGETGGQKASTAIGNKKKVTVKQLLLESMNGDEEEEEEGDDDDSDKPLTHVQEQAKLKRDLLDAANGRSEATADNQADDEEDEDDLFKVRINSTTSTSSSTPSQSSPPTAALSSTAFLTSYLSHQWWKADPSTLPSWSAIRGEQPNPSLPSLSDEEDEEDREEAFEAAYNFRHQEEGGSEVKTWPRIIEDSVRRKDNTRKAARERKKEAQLADKQRQQEELKRIKNDKLRGMQEKVRQVEEVSGVALDDEVRQGLRLDRGWDEEEHERLMARLFDTDYYDKGTADENEEAAIERLRREEEEEDEKTNKSAGGRGRLLSTVHPKVRQELLADMDELYALDYEDVIGGGAIKTRFHYTKVKPDTYGLTLDDILDKDDRELNKKISIKKLAPYRAENEPVEEDWVGGGGRKGGRVRGGGGYHERRVEGVKRKLEAKKKDKQKQQATSEDGAGPTNEKKKKQTKAKGTSVEEGADGAKQEALNGSGPAAVRTDGKLTATQKRRLREKHRKARLTGTVGGAADTGAAEPNGTDASHDAQHSQKRLKTQK